MYIYICFVLFLSDQYFTFHHEEENLISGFNDTISKKYEYNTSVGTHEVAQNHVKIAIGMELFWFPHELNKRT